MQIELTKDEAELVVKALESYRERVTTPIRENDAAVNLIDYIKTVAS